MSNPRIRKRALSALAGLVAASLVLAACSSGSSSSATTSASTSAAESSSAAAATTEASSQSSAAESSSAPSSSSAESSAAQSSSAQSSAAQSSAGSSTAASSASSSGGSTDTAADPGVDDGTKLTLWTRAPLEKQAKELVAAYNSSHKNQVALTVVPNDDYVAKVGAAAGAKQLPDLFAADIVYVPNWTSQGLFQDLTSKIDGLSYASQLNQGHIVAGTFDSKKFVVPFVLDLSVMMWNKALYKEAGLDPDKGPDHAGRIRQPGEEDCRAEQAGGLRHLLRWQLRWLPGVHLVPDDLGIRRAGDEPGRHPIAAQRPRGQAGLLHLPRPGQHAARDRRWGQGGDRCHLGRRVPAGQGRGHALSGDPAGHREPDGRCGPCAALPGVSGGESTFVGGDGIGVSKDSKSTEQAWNFLVWLTSKDAQVDVLAKGGDIVSRGDLADNQYSEKDPRVLTVNQVAAKGQTPLSVNFQQAFNATDSPWLTLIRNAIWGSGSTVDSDNDQITSVLSQ